MAQVAWRDKPESNGWPEKQLSSNFTVEKALTQRLETLRESLIQEAENRSWDQDAVDRILTSGGLEPWTREYIVSLEVTEPREVTVRSTSRAAAGESVDGQGRLVGVREVGG